MQLDNKIPQLSRVAGGDRAKQSALPGALFAFCLAAWLCACGGELLAQAAAPGAAEPAAPASETPERAARDETQAERRRGLVQAELARDGESRFRYARELFADGRYARARDLLEDFLLLFPEHPRRIEALRIAAEIDARNGDVEAAVARFTRAYREAPDGEIGARAYLQAGRLLAASGEPERARPIFEEVKRRVPSSATARLADQELLALELPRPRAVGPSDERPLLQDGGDATADLTRNADINTNADSAQDAPLPATSDRGVVADRRPAAEAGSSPTASGAPTAGATASRPQSGRPAARDSRGEAAQSGQAPGAGRDARGDALDRMGEGVEEPPAR